MIYDIRVTHTGNGPYFQTYVETVEAATAHDAISRVQRRNPDCLVQCEDSYNKPRESSAISNVGSAMGWIMLLGAIFILWVLVEYWMIVAPIALMSFIGFLVWKFTE